MKRALFLIAAAAVLSTVPGNAFSEQAKTIKGEIVELSCYCTTGSRGPEHKACTVKCLEQGEPSGIVEEGTGKLYVMISAGHNAEFSRKMAKHATKTVEATGKVNERGGITTIDISDVKEVAEL